MPTRPARACRIGACPNPAVSRGRCAVHAPAHQADQHRFGTAIYNDTRWRGKHGLRRQVLAASPFCVRCLERHQWTLATCVDHIRPHRGDERLAFDRTNLRPLCSQCHGEITAQATWRR